jgi:hypothetical protein
LQHTNWRYLIRNTNVYLSLFIDEINTDRIFDPNKSHRQIAFTCGVKTFDVPWDNMNLSIEYARVNPATYNHNVPSNTFANNGFSLGSWMGQNADDLFFEIGFRPGYSLKLTGFTEVFRKGGDLPIADQYSEDQGNWKYLFGPLHVERSFGITARYQILRDVFVDFKGMIKNIYDENDPSMNRTDQFEYYLGASLGIW